MLEPRDLADVAIAAALNGIESIVAGLADDAPTTDRELDAEILILEELTGVEPGGRRWSELNTALALLSAARTTMHPALLDAPPVAVELGSPTRPVWRIELLVEAAEHDVAALTDAVARAACPEFGVDHLDPAHACPHPWMLMTSQLDEAEAAEIRGELNR